MGRSNQPISNPVDYAGLAKTDIVKYVKAVFASPDYQALTEEGKKSTRDYMYSTDVIPFYKNQGQTPPPRSALEPNGTAEPEPTDVNYKKFLTKGGLIGLAKSGAGTVNTLLELSHIPLQLVHGLLSFGDRGRVEAANNTPTKDVENALSGLDSLKMNMTNMKENAVNFYNDAFGEPTNTKEKLSEMAGELGGQLPAFLIANKALGAIGSLGKLREGAGAVPLFVKNLPSSVRYIAASQTIQKSLYAALEGGLAAHLTDNPEDTGSWAAFGAILPPAWQAVKKPFTMIFARDGALGVGKLFEGATNWAKQAKGSRPVPKNADDAAQALLTSKLDEGASAVKEGKDFSEITPEQQVTVVQKASNELHKLITNPDEETVAELAGTEHEVATTLSPLAKQTDDEISSIATQAGVKTPKEIVTKRAAADTQRATITDKVKTQAVTETVPEADHTLTSQLDAVKAGDKQAMVVPKETVKTLGAIPDELGVQTFQDGQAVIFNKESISANKVKELKLKNRINEVIDYPVSKEEVAQAVAKGEEPVTVLAKDAVTGAEKETVAASSSSAVETVEAVQKHFPEAEVTVTGAEGAANAVKERLIGQIKHGAMNQVQAQAYEIMLKKELPVSAKSVAEVADGIKAWREAGLPEEELQTLLREIEAKKIQIVDEAKKTAALPSEAASKAEAPAPTIAERAKTVETPAALVSAREEAKDAAKALANETNMINKVSIMERLNKALEQVKKLEAKYGITEETKAATEAPSQIEKPTVKAAKKAKADKEAPSDRNVASGLAVKIEIRKSGLAENEAYAILKKAGYSSTKDIPEGPEAEDLLEQIRVAALKKTPFYPAIGNQEILTSDPTSAYEGAQKVILKPTKVLNMDTGFDPVFVRHIKEDFPQLDVSPLAPQKAFMALQEQLGAEKNAMGDWLRSKGYDLIHQGGDETLVEVLNPDVVKTLAVNKAEKMADAAVATGATTVEQARAASKAVKDVEAELARLQNDAIAKGEVSVTKVTQSGKQLVPNDSIGPSTEELGRGEINYKVTRTGLTHLGAKIDAGTLQDNEAVIAINKATGKMRVVNSNFQMSDLSVIDKYGDRVKIAAKAVK